MKSYREVAIPKDPAREALRLAKAAMKGKPKAKGLAEIEARVAELEAVISNILERFNLG